MAGLALAILASGLAPLSLSGCASAPARVARTFTSTALRTISRPPWPAARGPAAGPLVAAANPLAAEAGMAVLRQGGSAVDAAVAVQAMLGLVEPQSSGLGGGAFLLVYDPATRTVTAFDGRERAPAATGPDLFLDEHGLPLRFDEAVRSGRSVGAPGAVAMLDLAHARFGIRPWGSLFGAAVRTAEQGFVISPRLARFIASDAPGARAPDAQAYFRRPDGAPMGVGDRLVNPAYAQSLRTIADSGGAGLLGGPLAAAIAARVAAGPLPGALTEADLAAYRPRSGPALCRPWRVYVVCVPPPPSSGVSLLQGLALLDRADVDHTGPADARAWLSFIEASRLMYADRDRYVADPDFVTVPVDGLLDPGYVRARAALIGDRFGAEPAAGTPPGAVAVAADATVEAAGTSHFVIIDSRGQVVSMTTTVESPFGSGRMVGGFFLNNQLTDFSLQPRLADGRLAGNAPGPSKRPRSSMTPVVVLDRQGRFLAAVGSPGGSSILAYVLKTMVGVFDWGLPMQQAIDLPNVVARGPAARAEISRMDPQLVEALKGLGVDLRASAGEDSGLHGAIVRSGRVEAGVDPRREGVALTR